MAQADVAASADVPTDKQVTVKLFTSLDAKFRVPDAPIVRLCTICAALATLHCLNYDCPLHNRLRSFAKPSTDVQSVPANVTRFGLSTVINHLLELGAHSALAASTTQAARSGNQHRRFVSVLRLCDYDCGIGVWP